MKKINMYFSKPDVQGAVIIGLIFVSVAVATLLTWGK
jgi:hypothetical protein